MPLSKIQTLFENEELTVTVGGKAESFTVETENSFNIIFFLSATTLLQAEDLISEIQIPKNSYILHYSSEKRNAQFVSIGNQLLDFLHIRLDYDFVSKLINPEENSENNKILNQMMANQFILFNQISPPRITVEMHMIIKEITGSSKKGVLQKLLIEAKIIKLLMLIFEQFDETKKVFISENTAIITKSFVDKYYTQQISTHDIALKFGFNETKIRAEFKSEFKTTVSEYINELRMLKAKKMIISKKHLIKEIAMECGYEYVPNFSRAFKKKYGISPDKLRNI